MTDTSLITQSLLSRLATSSVKPLSSLEFWILRRSAPLGELPGRTPDELCAKFGISPNVADRIPALLERSRALALATEEFEHKGFWTVTGGDENYPSRLRERLGDQAPAILYGVGDVGLLGTDGVGVVGSRDIGPASQEVARSAARVAANVGVPVISGGARGVDQQAMNAAFEYGGTVVGALADSLLRTASESSTRHAIAEERLCLVTPYSPSAPFSAGNAMGRNKIIYGLSRAVVVVRSDKDSGGTWAGATEALKKRYSTVFSWLGAGAGPGNQPLVELGAVPIESDEELRERLLSAEPVSAAAKSASVIQQPLF